MIAEEIRNKLKEAMRAKDQIALDTYRSVISGFTTELVANGKTPQEEVTDDIATKVINKLARQRKDSIAQYEIAGRSELADIEKTQLEILEKFLPEQMSEDKIKEIAISKKAELGIEDRSKLGILVGAVMKETQGQADGSIVKKVIENLF